MDISSILRGKPRPLGRGSRARTAQLSPSAASASSFAASWNTNSTGMAGYWFQCLRTTRARRVPLVGIWQLRAGRHKPSLSVWSVECGHTDNADVVGEMNVLARGHRVAACAEDGSGFARKRKTKPASVKQKPTEATMCEVTHV